MISRLLPLRRPVSATALLSSLFLIFLLASLPCPAFPQIAPPPTANIEPLRIIGGTLNYGSGFRIILSRPLTHAEANADREALKSLISISPEAAWSIDSYDCDLYLRIRDTDKGLKPTTCYTVTFKKGFPIQGAPLSLEDDISLSFITPDLPSSFRYASDGNFFPLHAPIWELPVTSVNLESDVDVSLAEAYPNRIVNFLLKSRHSYRYNDNCFRELARKKLALKTPRNKKTAHSLDLEEAGIPRNRPGFYLLTTRFCQKEYSYYSQRYYNDNDSTQRLIVVTDMALFVSVCGPEYAIQVRRLSDPSQPVANVRLEIYSGKEQLLCSGVTDKEGVCRLQKPCPEDKDDWQALLLARNPQDGDIAFLTWEAYDSRAAAAPMSTLFIDRDICRPGEQVQATAALRQREDGTALEGVPLELALLDVSNSEMASQTVQSDACGLAQATFKIPSGALLGNYTIVLRAAGGNSSPVYGRHSFMVSEFTPDQIEGKVEMSLAEKGLRYNGSAAYYFGQPVSQATVKLNLNISWGDYQAPDAYRAYAFGGVAKEKPGQTAQTVQAVTGDDGLFSGEIPLSPTPAEWGNIYNCAQPLRFMLQAEISGNAGTRPIVARAQKDFHFTDYYLGARVLPEEKSADGNVRRISLVALDTEGNPLAMPEGITCRLSRLEWHYLLKEAWDGTCRREWQCVDELIDEFPVEIDEKGEFDLHLPGSDHYTLLFQEADGKRLLCKTDFWHWAGESAIRSPNPMRLDFTLDRKEYLPGQTAQISFVAEQDGEAMVTSGTEGTPMRLFSRPIKAGPNTIEVEIPQEAVCGRWFVAVTAVGRITTEENGRPIDAPHQSGIATLIVRQDKRHLDVGLDAPDTCRPGDEATLTVTLKDNEGKPAAGEVVLWGVDEGILALTGYKTPDIHGAFFGQMECPIDIMDLYSAIYPMLRVVNGMIGGGYASNTAALSPSAQSLSKYRQERQGQLPPERVLRLGIVRVGADGKAQVPFKVPAEAGALRLMAVATNATAVGSAEKRLTIHAAATVQCLAPQAVAPGDTFQLLGTLFNHDVKDPHFTWEVAIDGTATLTEMPSRSGEAAKGANFSFAQEIIVPETAQTGPLTIRLKAVDADGTSYTAEPCVIQIRDVVLRLPETSSLVLAPGESRRFHFDADEYGTLEVGSPMLPLMRHIHWLNDYPYGCLEQTVAAAFPQLAVPILAHLNLVPKSFIETARTKVMAALDRLSTMRCGNAFSMWPGGREQWLEGSLFAYLFILEADRHGFTLSGEKRREITDYLRIYLNHREHSDIDRALATYMLSLAAPELTLEYVKMLPLNDEVPQMDQIHFLAAMALIQGGFAAEGNMLLKELEEMGGFGDFGGGSLHSSPLDSPTRSTGLALWLLAEKLPEHKLVPRLAADLLRLEASDGSYFTTHEHAWAALGLSQYLAACLMDSRNGNGGMKKPEGPSLLEADAHYGATLELQPLRGTAEKRVWEDSGFGQQKPCRVNDFSGDILLTNTGDTELLVETSRRVAQPRTKPVRNGLAVARKFYSAAGLPVMECTAGDLLEVQITLKGKAADDLVICDLLPGGFEIEDPTLLTRTVIPPTPPEKEKQTALFLPKLLERRFDRMLTFGNFRGCEDNQPGLVLRYHVRAVAPGRYSIPQVQVEPMYNPKMNALSAAPEEPFVIHPRKP